MIHCCPKVLWQPIVDCGAPCTFAVTMIQPHMTCIPCLEICVSTDRWFSHCCHPTCVDSIRVHRFCPHWCSKVPLQLVCQLTAINSSVNSSAISLSCSSQLSTCLRFVHICPQGVQNQLTAPINSSLQLSTYLSTHTRAYPLPI